MNLKFCKSLFYLAFLLAAPKAAASRVIINCDYLWAYSCNDCAAPLLMDCEEGLRGHLRSDSRIHLLKAYFYVEGHKGAEVRTVEIGGFQMYPSYREDEHANLLKDKIQRAFPNEPIVGYRFVYTLDMQKTPLYKDSGAKEVLPKIEWLSALWPEEIPIDIGDFDGERQSLSKSKTGCENFNEGASVSDGGGAACLPEMEDNTKAKRKPFADSEDFQVKPDEEIGPRFCWPVYGSDTTVVYFTDKDPDKGICVIRAYCSSPAPADPPSGDSGQTANQRFLFRTLLCQYDSVAQRCPPATECSKDPRVSGRFDWESHDSVYGGVFGRPIIPLTPPATQLK